jgi:pyruvate kinase
MTLEVAGIGWGALPPRRTKLVCTLGPASSGRVAELAAAGMDVARINFSHGTPASRSASADAVRRAASEVGRPIPILADLAGPKIRLGEVAGGSVELEAGRSCSGRTAAAATATRPVRR